ncbi:hypothetical protein LHJ74_25425 [Streptomyces sp. N2-109]|uniref:Integral membrane protein n=1 Tax=Streptomyces gossypii TaxID=2883101 RepID=A0ABT2JZ74_9ACTN|nr:hypothetical protein [Streptomyces gossypii]MCT2593207.1 hypothetical protein [Streptomyces gossypii]
MADPKAQAPPRFPGFYERFGVFAESLLVGMWVVLASLPLVTYPAAFAAGARHLRRHLDNEQAGWREFAADVRTAGRRGWLVGLAGWAAVWLLWLDLSAVRAGLPGGQAVAAVGVLAFLGCAVAGARAAAVWHPGASWRALLGAAGRRTVLDPAGSLLIVCGGAVTVASAWFAAPLAIPVTGAVTAAAVAVEKRYAHR